MCQLLDEQGEMEVKWGSENMVMTVDTTPLNTLTSQELDRLMAVALQLHRKFGHPSNRLLIKNLRARNADSKVIAAVSLLKCDECQEGKIRLPAPAVNLERTDKLWSCLQIDGFSMRLGCQVHHFVLMVDEASGYSVIREAFRHHEDEHQNLSGEQLVDVLREAWFSYFGYPERLKMDLEGAHRSTVLSEECITHGIEIIAAPAEHHQLISEVERTIGHVRQKIEVFLREQSVDPKIAALTMVMTHNSLARVHGFSPLQWTLGRDWSPGLRLVESTADEISQSETNPFGAHLEVRVAAEKAFLEHRAHDVASRAKNAKTRGSTQFLPGDMIYFRRLQHPADLPANSMVDRPRLRVGRWYGPGRVLACETKVDGQFRRPSLIVWAVAGGRLKRFHASQLRHASEAERLVAESTSAVTMPWTMTSLSKLMAKGTYDDEVRPRRKHWPRTSKEKRQKARKGLPQREPPGLPVLREPVPRQEDSDEELISDREMRKRAHPEPSATMGGENEWDPERLLQDVEYLPDSFNPDFRQQRRTHEQDDRPWHVRRQDNIAYLNEEDVEQGIFSAVVDIPEDEKAWKRILKDPGKFMSKKVQKGVEVAWNRLNEDQKAAMNVAKTAELDSWIAKKVVKAACPSIKPDQALRMRWVYTFKNAGEDQPGKLKAKARIVILGLSDPQLLEQDTSSPSLSRLSKMLLLNAATAYKWRVLSGDVKTAFLQAKSPERLHPLYCQPLPELAKKMNLKEHQMVELLGSAYGLTSAPREWYVDLTGTIKRMKIARFGWTTVNKLVREIHSSRHVSIKVQNLGGPPEELCFIGFSDAALANRPGGGSTGGFLLGLIHPRDLEKGEGRINLVSWRSTKLQRVARSSLAAEVQAMSELEQETMYARLTWAELLGHIVNPDRPRECVVKVNATLIVDAKAMYDVLEKGEVASSAYSLKDKYTALELQSLSQHITEQGTNVQWCDSDHQAADGMTKSQKQDSVRKFVMTGVWKFRLDGAFISAKKRRAMHHESSKTT
ncbi:unnamed protein product, partial [Symbiodinium sp. CCMP2456]